MALFPVRRAVAVVMLSVASLGLALFESGDAYDVPERTATANFEDIAALQRSFVEAAQRAPFELAAAPVAYRVSFAHRAPSTPVHLAAVTLPGRASAPRQSVPSRSRRKLRVWERGTEA